MKRLGIHIALVTLAWLGTLAFKPEIEAAFSAWARRRAHHEKYVADNPLHPAMTAVAQKYGVDVSFIAHAYKTRELDVASLDLFRQRPGSLDVIVFGDSSLVWSFSPQLVAQASGKRVAFVGTNGALPNRSFVAMAEQLADVYLERDGQVVFLFKLWNAGQDSPQRTLDLVKMTRPPNGSLWRREVERSFDALFALPHLAVYGDLVEPWYAPSRYEAKQSSAERLGAAFYSWGAGSGAVFLHRDKNNGEPNAADAKVVRIRDTLTTSCAGHQERNVAANLRAFADSRIRHKVLAFPFSDYPNPDLVCEAQRLKDELPILDLPRLAVEQHGLETLELESVSHLANTSSIPASVILGRALRELP